MKAAPILFSGPMIRALLDGRKTQTRRFAFKGDKPTVWKRRYDRWEDGERDLTIWVRENFRLRQDQDHKPPSQDWWKDGALYAADVPPPMPTGCGGGPGKLRPSIHMPRWASRLTLEVTDMRMERLQDISEEDARAEGIQTGVEHPNIRDPENWWSAGPGSTAFSATAKDAFADLWASINGPESWEANPEVIAVSFAVHQRNIDEDQP